MHYYKARNSLFLWYDIEKGDTIGILSASGGISDYDNILRAKDYFLSLGFNVKISDTTSKHFRYMAGSDEERRNCH
mgnify:CR=1 FL=1